MSDFGSGPFLTEDLDFEVTNTGDIRTTSGLGELEKDVGIQSLIELDDVLGRPMRPDTKARISAKVRRTLNQEPRIDSVSNVAINFISPQNEAEVIAGVIADDSDQELVFGLR